MSSIVDNGSEATRDSVIFQDINNFIRVTEVLYPFSGLDKINPDVVDKAAKRGTRVHEICEGIIMGFPPIGVDDTVQPYIDSFNQWWSTRHKVIAMEKRFFDLELGITGQVDLIIEEPEGLAIVDLKTSYRPSKTWALQGSAYAYMARNNGYDIKSIKFLHLNKWGDRPKIHVYEDQWDLYKKCLDVYRFFYHKKTKVVA